MGRCRHKNFKEFLAVVAFDASDQETDHPSLPLKGAYQDSFFKSLFLRVHSGKGVGNLFANPVDELDDRDALGEVVNKFKHLPAQDIAEYEANDIQAKQKQQDAQAGNVVYI